MSAEPHLLEADRISQVLRQRRRAQRHLRARERRRGDLHPRRQRRGQVELHQDPLGRVTSRTRAGCSSTARRCTSQSPRDARAKRHRDRLPGSRDGAADVDLAELLPRRRAAEALRAARLARRGDREARSCATELHEMGIDIRDPDQPVGTLSGGERQSVAIARAVYFGARVLILDEPTSALGVKQAGVVLKYILQARDRGVAVIFITHNPHHAYPVGDRFVILNRGQSLGSFEKSEIDSAGARAADGGRPRAGGARARARGDQGGSGVDSGAPRSPRIAATQPEEGSWRRGRPRSSKTSTRSPTAACLAAGPPPLRHRRRSGSTSSTARKPATG